MTTAESLALRIAAKIDVYDKADWDGEMIDRVAALIAPHLAGEWLPIKDAPKDGTEILGLMADRSVASTVYISRKDIWVSPDGGYVHDPVAWLPRNTLPAPPKEKSP